MVFAMAQMRFLVDTNLPPTVATLITSLGHEARHTSDIGLEGRRTGNLAARQVQQPLHRDQDEDFVLVKASDPSCPCVVWVRIGNAVRRIIEKRIAAAWPSIVTKLNQGESVVELR